uniref:ATP synthase complex subunit 8 n=1 Tax=Pylocheles mortensenii TaxID=941203 RepID=A0A3S6J3P7_9EUCA|nr:ATP synthase F0 subunit 8 [Pylocheles mortensenii]
MPQMAPLLWLNLMFMFLISFTLFFMFNYFVFTGTKIKPYYKIHILNHKTWKW